MLALQQKNDSREYDSKWTATAIDMMAKMGLLSSAVIADSSRQYKGQIYITHFHVTMCTTVNPFCQTSPTSVNWECLFAFGFVMERYQYSLMVSI